MTAQAPVTATPSAVLPAHVDQRLARATAGLCRDHPALAATVRGVLAPLRDRLYRLHAACRQADDQAWAAYTADLDRGLDELSVEVQRAGTERAADDVLTAAAARLELRAWQLRLDTLRAEGRDVATAQQVADSLTAALAAGQPVRPGPDLAALRQAGSTPDRG